jgi:hypothetical protein
MCERGPSTALRTGFETAPEKRGLLSPNGVVIDLKGNFPLVLRSHRILAASRSTVRENIDSLFSSHGRLPEILEGGEKTVLRL